VGGRPRHQRIANPDGHLEFRVYECPYDPKGAFSETHEAQALWVRRY